MVRTTRITVKHFNQALSDADRAGVVVTHFDSLCAYRKAVYAEDDAIATERESLPFTVDGQHYRVSDPPLSETTILNQEENGEHIRKSVMLCLLSRTHGSSGHKYLFAEIERTVVDRKKTEAYKTETNVLLRIARDIEPNSFVPENVLWLAYRHRRNRTILEQQRMDAKWAELAVLQELIGTMPSEE